FGLKNRNGAVVMSVSPGSAAARAGLEPGDVVISYNGKPIKNRDELVSMVVATRPGMTVPVRIVRDKLEKTVNVTVDELNLEAETQPSKADNGNGAPQETTSGFGMSLSNITPQIAQQLRLDSST